MIFIDRFNAIIVMLILSWFELTVIVKRLIPWIKKITFPGVKLIIQII